MALQLTYVKCSESKYSVKCPYTMTPTGITVHNTANDASAMNEVSYMLTNNNQVSFHYAVDDTRAVQGLPLTRNGWHAGDGGKGTGNRKTIGIEICYSKSGGERYDKAFDNALTLVAQLMKQYNFTTKDVYYHKDWSGKYCPHRALDNEITIAKFRKLVQERYDELYPTLETYSGYVKVLVNSLKVRNKASWEESDVCGYIKKDEVYTVVGRIKVDGVYQYKLKSGKYVTSASKYVKYSKTKFATTTSVVGKTLYLPNTVSHWNVYPLSKSPTVGNECGALNPKKFGGLTYTILAQPYTDVVTISTYNYGKVNIYVGKDTPAVIK